MFNGYVSDKDRATGKPVRPLLLSVHADRDEFGEMILDEPDWIPKACLRIYLNAVMSPHPYDLEAVTPVLQFDLSEVQVRGGDERHRRAEQPPTCSPSSPSSSST